MSLSAVRLAMMERFAQISGVDVPDDPLPARISDKTILVFPRSNQSAAQSRGKDPGSVGILSEDVMQVEYHRRVSYENLGSTMGDITTMIQTIGDTTWGEHAGGKFDGTILGIRGVSLVHLGALGWNEWTFGARLEISFAHTYYITS